jgi:hypothetical protein
MFNTHTTDPSYHCKSIPLRSLQYFDPAVGFSVARSSSGFRAENVVMPPMPVGDERKLKRKFDNVIGAL